MRPGARHGVAVLVGLAAVGWLVSCKDSNSVAGPSPTPTPTPPPLSGSWVGTFMSDHPVLCVQGANGASAQLNEAGSDVTGTLTAYGGACHINATIQATRLGNSLTGIATDGAFTGTITGTVDSTQLQLVVAVLSDGQGYEPGGTATLHRP